MRNFIILSINVIDGYINTIFIKLSNPRNFTTNIATNIISSTVETLIIILSFIFIFILSLPTINLCVQTQNEFGYFLFNNSIKPSWVSILLYSDLIPYWVCPYILYYLLLMPPHYITSLPFLVSLNYYSFLTTKRK